MSGPYPAKRLCDLASDWLASRYPDALIVRELSVGKWGKAMIDIAAITPSDIIGIEIKGDGDSGARLELQGHTYSRVATHMFLLTAPNLDRIVEKHKPVGWWHLRANDQGVCAGRLDLQPWERPARLPNAPAIMLECLITRELKRLARLLVPTKDIGTTVDSMILAMSEHAPMSAIRTGVCAALRERDWIAYDRSINKVRDDRYRWADGRPVSRLAA